MRLEAELEDQLRTKEFNSSNRWHMMDALALIGDNGRDKLRKAMNSGKYALTHGSPMG